MKCFETEASWAYLKEMFKRIAASGTELDRSHRIAAKELVGDFDLRQMKSPRDAKDVYSWMQQSEGKRNRIANIQITIRRMPESDNCQWNLYQDKDGKDYCIDGILVDRPSSCKYRSHCGALCAMLYKGLMEKDYNYENTFAGPGRAKNKGR